MSAEGFPSPEILVRKQRETGADALMISSFSSFQSKTPAKGTMPLEFKVNSHLNSGKTLSNASRGLCPRGSKVSYPENED